ncbi:hypothetical protein LUZ60_001650 [Juncus effusus]|nr:hypothetical protein LUZ60_001650 [Juncus effusus]
MDQKQQRGSNKIRDIVRLHQLLKKWKKLALSSPSNKTQNNNKSVNFLKKTLSFSDITSALSSAPVPKGYFSVCVGEEMKRYVVPTDCLSHMAFVDLLREAEEEFGFQQEGVLRIPCDVSVFESVLRVVMKKKDGFASPNSLVYCSAEVDCSRTHHRQHKSLCR